MFAREGNSLCMIPGTGAYNSPLTFFFVEALNQVVSSSQFVGAHYLEILPLEIDPRPAALLAQPGGVGEPLAPGQAAGGPQDIGTAVHDERVGDLPERRIAHGEDPAAQAGRRGGRALRGAR